MNNDFMHNQGTALSQEQQLFVTELQGIEADFVLLCEKIGKSRELSLAVTNMQQAAMWAIRHLLEPK